MSISKDIYTSLALGVVIGFVSHAVTARSIARAEDMPTTCAPKVYACESGRVIDGDTFEAQCDLGLGVLRNLTVRVHGIDTPETYGAKREPKRGAAATAATIEWLDMRARQVRLVDMGRGKYGRQVMVVESVRGESLSEFLRMRGHEK